MSDGLSFTTRWDAAEESVSDVKCKAIDLDNLYVVDNRSFHSIAAVNPVLDSHC